MNDTEEFTVGNSRVGYVVRGSLQRAQSNKKLPLENPVHADCILPGGRIAGCLIPEDSFDNANFICRKKKKGLDCEIFFEDEMERYLWDMKSAYEHRMLSTFVLFNVTSRQALLFNSFWEEAKKSTARYNYIFNNCSTFCYEAFKHAEILEKGLLQQLTNSIMTPARLYFALIEKYSRPAFNLITNTGYFGVVSDKLGGNKITLKKI